MGKSKYRLPDDAPEKLARLLGRWHEIAEHRRPTPDDLLFDELVDEHPGLVLIEPVYENGRRTDLRYLRIGPEYAKWIGRNVRGVLFSDVLKSPMMARVYQVYFNSLDTCEPHYWEIANTVYGAPTREFVRILLPLYDGNGDAHRLLVCCVWKG